MIDTSKFTVVRGEALLKAKGKEPRAIMNDGKPIGTHPHGLSMPRAIAKHKTMDAERWVALAQASDDERPALMQTWYSGASNVAADGYRMHRVDGQRMSKELAWASRYEYEQKQHIVPDYLALFPRDTPYRFTIATQALVSALHAVKPFARDSSDIVRFETSESALVVRATSWECGDAQATIDGTDYGASNALPSEFALKSKYALDALAGMGERTEIATHGQYGQHAFVFTSTVQGVGRKALVMPMHISR